MNVTSVMNGRSFSIEDWSHHLNLHSPTIMIIFDILVVSTFLRNLRFPKILTLLNFKPNLSFWCPQREWVVLLSSSLAAAILSSIATAKLDIKINMAVNILLLSAVFLILYREHCNCTFAMVMVVTGTFFLHSYCVSNLYVSVFIFQIGCRLPRQEI